MLKKFSIGPNLSGVPQLAERDAVHEWSGEISSIPHDRPRGAAPAMWVVMQVKSVGARSGVEYARSTGSGAFGAATSTLRCTDDQVVPRKSMRVSSTRSAKEAADNQ